MSEIQLQIVNVFDLGARRKRYGPLLYPAVHKVQF